MAGLPQWKRDLLERRKQTGRSWYAGRGSEDGMTSPTGGTWSAGASPAASPAPDRKGGAASTPSTPSTASVASPPPSPSRAAAAAAATAATEKPAVPSNAKGLWKKAAMAVGGSGNKDMTSTVDGVDKWAETLSLWEAEKQRLREESKRIECEMYTAELAGWFSALFEEEIGPAAFFDRIWDGSMLCGLAGKITDEEVRWAQGQVDAGGDPAVLSTAKRLRKPKAVRARHDAVAWDNINQYVKWCQAFGLPEAVLFEAPAVHAKDRTVLVCLMETARRAHIDVVPELVEQERLIEAEAGLEDEAAAERERERLRLLEEQQAAEEAAERARIEEENRRIQEAMAREAAMLEELRLLEEKAREQRLEEDQLEAMILASEKEALQEKLRSDKAERDDTVIQDELASRRRSIELAASIAASQREEARRAELQRHQLRQRKLEAERDAARQAAEIAAAAELAAKETAARQAAEAARREREERARLANEAAERERLEAAMREAENEQAASRAAEELARAKEEADRRRVEHELEEERRREQDAKEAAEHAAYLEALAARRAEIEAAIRQQLAEAERLSAAIEELDSTRALDRGRFVSDLEAATRAQEDARRMVDEAEQLTGDTELQIIQEKLAEKEEVQRILAEQKRETEEAHQKCKAKLVEIAQHEQILANARSSLANIKARRMEAEAAVYKSKLDMEVQQMVKSSGADVELIRIREGTYMVAGSTKKLFIRILHTNIMVRVGGGWETLKSWLSKHTAQITGTPGKSMQPGVSTITVGQQTFVTDKRKGTIQLRKPPPSSPASELKAAADRAKLLTMDAKTLVAEERRAAKAVADLEAAIGVEHGGNPQAVAAAANVALVKSIEAAHAESLARHHVDFEQKISVLTLTKEQHIATAEGAAMAAKEAAQRAEALHRAEQTAHSEMNAQQQELAESLGEVEAKTQQLQSELSGLTIMERTASPRKSRQNSSIDLLSAVMSPRSSRKLELDAVGAVSYPLSARKVELEPAETAIPEASPHNGAPDVDALPDIPVSDEEGERELDLPDIPSSDEENGGADAAAAPPSTMAPANVIGDEVATDERAVLCSAGISAGRTSVSDALPEMPDMPDDVMPPLPETPTSAGPAESVFLGPRDSVAPPPPAVDAASTLVSPQIFDESADKKWFEVSLGLSQDDVDVYGALWDVAVPDGGMALLAAGATEFLTLSGLPQETLKQIWSLSDTNDPRGQLTRDEFFTACKLIATAQAGRPLVPAFITAKGIPLPTFDGPAEEMMDGADPEHNAEGGRLPDPASAEQEHDAAAAADAGPIELSDDVMEVRGSNAGGPAVESEIEITVGDQEMDHPQCSESLQHFLEHCGVLEKALPVLEENEIEDVATLQLLSKDDLISLGLKMGTVAKILRGLSESTT